LLAQAGESPLEGCPRLHIPYIRSYSLMKSNWIILHFKLLCCL